MARLTCVAMLLVALSLVSIAENLYAEVNAKRCDRCGASATCKKVCRLVREEKKVEITCWGCEPEEFCVPGPSTKKCDHCEPECEDCEESPTSVFPLSLQKHFVWSEWIPGTARIHTKKKLMKRTETKTVPSFKWVVEDLCAKCNSRAPRPSADD
jgi:hypothetical protein